MHTFGTAPIPIPSSALGVQVLSRLEDSEASAIESEMPKTIAKWLLFTYVNGEFTPLSKPLKTKQLAEKARSKYPERERKTIGIGVFRFKP
jgi:hypothetical protein